MIAKHDLEQLLNQARVKLVGVSDAQLKAQLYDVCDEFLNDSSAWTEDITFLAITTQRSYQLTPTEGQIIRLEGVQTPTTPDGSTQTGIPPGVFIPALMPEVGTVQLEHAPNTNTNYVATVVLNVALPTDRSGVPIAPDWLLPLWHRGILSGLLGNLMVEPGKSYSNEKTGAYHLKRFRDAIARARVSKLRAKTNGAQAWRFPQTFRTTNQRGGIPSVGSSNDRTF